MRLYYNKYTKEFSILTIKRGVEVVKFKGKNYLLGKYYEYAPRIYILLTPLQVRAAMNNAHPKIILCKTRFPRFSLFIKTLKEVTKYVSRR